MLVPPEKGPPANCGRMKDFFGVSDVTGLLMASPNKHPISPPPQPPTEELRCRLFIYLLFVYVCNPSCYIGRRQLIMSVMDLLTGTPQQKSQASGAKTNCFFFVSKSPSFLQSAVETINLRHWKQPNDHNTNTLPFEGYIRLLLDGF